MKVSEEMQERKKLMIYPFAANDIAFVRFLEQMQDTYSVGAVCSPLGSNLIGKDIGYAENREPLGYIVQAATTEAIEQNDALIILKEASTFLHEKSLKLMENAIDNKKDVICLMSLSEQEKSELKSRAEAIGVNFTSGLSLSDGELVTDTLNLLKAMQTPKVPVIFVGSLLEHGDLEEIISGLSKAFERQGYTVSCFVKRDMYNLLKMHSYDFLLNMEDIARSIKKLNYLVHAVESRERPDIIFVEVPGTMIKYNELIYGDFGVNAFIFSQAMQADAFVCSTHCVGNSQLFFKMMSDGFKGKFGFGIDVVHFTNKLADTNGSSDESIPSFFKMNVNTFNAIVEQEQSGNDIPYYSLLDDKSCDKSAEHLIKVLSNEQGGVI